MKTKTNLKAGKIVNNHSHTRAQPDDKGQGLRVRTSLKAGRIVRNHNEAWVAL